MDQCPMSHHGVFQQDGAYGLGCSDRHCVAASGSYHGFIRRTGYSARTPIGGVGSIARHTNPPVRCHDASPNCC